MNPFYRNSAIGKPKRKPVTRNWCVLCAVTGGITGTRAALLKAMGRTQYFTEEEARAEAKKLTEERNSSPYQTARFAYTAIRATGFPTLNQ